MTRLRLLERGAYRVAFVLFLAVTARFVWVIARHKWVNSVENSPSAQSQPATQILTLAALQKQVSGSLMTPNALDSAIAEAVGSANTPPARPPAAEYVKSYLSIQVGAPRSELRVDGVLVGRTPYVGQISCQLGRTVKIDLLPPKGMPKVYQIPCLPGEMRLREEP